MKTLLVIVTSLLICLSAFADINVTNYTATTGSGKSVARGCSMVIFDLVGFTGSIGNVSYSNITKVLTVNPSNAEGQRIGPIGYVVSSGTLNIMEVK